MVKVMRSIVRGPLVPFVAGFAATLLEQGYTRTSAEQHVCFITHLDRWLLARGLGVADLDESTIEQYLVQRRAAGFVEYRSDKAMQPLLEFLSPLGVLPPKSPIRLDAVEDLLARYGDPQPRAATRMRAAENLGRFNLGKTKTKTKNESLRCLKRRLIRVVFNALHTDQATTPTSQETIAA